MSGTAVLVTHMHPEAASEGVVAAIAAAGEAGVELVAPPDEHSKHGAAAEGLGRVEELLDELRSHDVPFTDADANILVDIGDRNVARGVPDLSADDPVIADQIARSFPQYTDQQRADVVRCLAEYVERTVAANRGMVPPDGDDHTG